MENRRKHAFEFRSTIYWGVPEGPLTIARRFNAGVLFCDDQAPKRATDGKQPKLPFGRPCGT